MCGVAACRTSLIVGVLAASALHGTMVRCMVVASGQGCAAPTTHAAPCTHQVCTPLCCLALVSAEDRVACDAVWVGGATASMPARGGRELGCGRVLHMSANRAAPSQWCEGLMAPPQTPRR